MVKSNSIDQKVKDDYIIPSTDIYETNEDFIIRVEMPGVKKENVDVSIEDEYLEIIGRVDNDWEKDLKIIEKEYRISDYYRRFHVGNKIDVEKINAKIEDGILTLTLPKSNEIKPRKIEIKS